MSQPAADHSLSTTPGAGTPIARVYAAALAHPDAIAVSAARADLRYADLVSGAERLATRLRQLGAGPGTRVGLSVERGPTQCVALLGTMLSGAAYVPLDPSYPAARLRAILRDCDPVLVIASPGVAPLFEGAAPLLIADDALERLPEPEPATACPPGFQGPRPEDVCYIIYTSGSTGTPKGVALSHSALCNLLDWQCRVPGLHDAARVLQYTPVGFDVHFQEFLGTWSTAGTLVLVDEETRRDPRALLSFIQGQEIRRIFLPFVALQQLCAAGVATGIFPATLREVITAGEQLVVDAALRHFFERLPGCRLHNHYGPSETHVVTSFTLSGPVESWESLPPIGREIDGARILLLDDGGRPVPPEQEGELWIGGACVADGYWNNPALSAERFVKLPGREGRWYRSGDLALRRPDGVLEFHGRADTQIKIRGHRVEPGEIEAAISVEAAVSACAVVARGDTAEQRHLVAYLVLAAGAAETDDARIVDGLRRRLAQQLPDYLWPARYVVLDALPRTPSGKLDRAALPAPGRVRPALRDAPVAPGTDAERRLAGLWSRLLDVEPVGVEDNFFDLGGSSTMALELALETERLLGRPVPVVTIFRHPTIRQLARELDGTATRDDAGARLADRAARQRAALSRRPGIARKPSR